MSWVWVCKQEDCGWYEFDQDPHRIYYICPECGRFMNKYDETARVYKELLVGAQSEASHRMTDL